MQHHVGIEMTAFSGIDLGHFCASGMDSVGIVISLLITFNHCKFQIIFQVSQGFFQKRSLAWTQGIRNSVLENARREIIRPEGMARCIDCDSEFKIHQFFDPCPNCNSHFVSILQGKEMRVKSLVVK